MFEKLHLTIAGTRGTPVCVKKTITKESQVFQQVKKES